MKEEYDDGGSERWTKKEVEVEVEVEVKPQHEYE